MTANRLLKIMQKIVDEGHGRRNVVVAKHTFSHPLEADGCLFLDVYHVTPSTITLLDGDGWTKTRADGRECLMNVVALYGASHDPGGAT